jgi:sugar lactone lactonase YvrE
MTAHQVTVWSPTPGLLSEGPRWHEERQELLWVDILGRQMHRANTDHLIMGAASLSLTRSWPRRMPR